MLFVLWVLWSEAPRPRIHSAPSPLLSHKAAFTIGGKGRLSDIKPIG